MGDDTWMSVFPNAFDPNMTFPYDSFNVEDLHTVDDGVIRHLFPLLEDPSKPFDFLIGHFLGVDHVGHRVGLDHPSMKAKLLEMNDVLERVVRTMDDETLLVVLGDHGMDATGDHGGDGVLETSAAMWLYSKHIPLTDPSTDVPSGLLQFRTFPKSRYPHRAIQQIDLVPTLSLLLGIPIPYNNLGSVIPELFWRGKTGQLLEKALEVNSAQIMRYLETYRSSASGNELNDAWPSLKASYGVVESPGIEGESKLVSFVHFNRVALGACNEIWAQFSPLLMAFGLSLLGMGLCAAWCVYSAFSREGDDAEPWLNTRLVVATRSGAVGGVVGAVSHLVLSFIMPGVTIIHSTVFGAALASSMAVIVATPPLMSFRLVKSTPIVLILHSMAFFSNSFTFWEDRMVPFLIVSSFVPYVLTGFTAPNTRLRYRILGFSLLFVVCIRLIAISTICREEQQPYCHVTFFASSSLPSPPSIILYLAVPVSAILPFVIQRFLHISRSDSGLAKTYLPVILAPSLLSGSAFWILEWADSASVFGAEHTTLLRLGRTWVAWFAFAWLLLAGGALWWLVPLCLDIQVSNEGGKRQVKVLGFANAFGSPYLMFWTITFGLVYLSTQLTGQVVLALAMVAFISYLEVLDSVRDAKTIEAAFNTATPSTILDPSASTGVLPPTEFKDIIPIALLGLQTFYATGHQSTISSIQWKSAFLLTSTVTYPFSVVTVFLNSVGPVFLFALAVPLVALWNRAPIDSTSTGNDEGKKQSINKDSTAQVKNESVLAGLGVMIYYSTLLLGTSVSAAILRRHLMVWKVFAPRFMAAVLELLVVDVGVLVGVGLGVERVANRVNQMFKGKVTLNG